ncbi:hypothetical protein BKH41_02705 [Helicobacter sp. 12S02232-10]|uniref:hypothetical protein n=1 Tax=Helicobacter sp. 12S02232-10 TaxID=1476197 RepID=UPI000BA7D7FB|nr:hypothetical protein [Helicobacter sp. 12S02232-10]PAF49592.1 hypothetical protein BKH41_02705 [Helicobacter sp. 12S02232-10]
MKKTKKTANFRLIGTSGISYDSRFYFEDRGLIRSKVKVGTKRVKGVLSPFIESLHRVEIIK